MGFNNNAFKTLKYLFYVYECFTCMYVFLLACMSVHQICARCLLRSEENVGSLELELQSCELPQGC